MVCTKRFHGEKKTSFKASARINGTAAVSVTLPTLSTSVFTNACQNPGVVKTSR
jgi:hypothetical protein